MEIKQNEQNGTVLVGKKIIKVEGNKIYLDNGYTIRVSAAELKLASYMMQNQNNY